MRVSIRTYPRAHALNLEPLNPRDSAKKRVLEPLQQRQNSSYSWGSGAWTMSASIEVKDTSKPDAVGAAGTTHFGSWALKNP